MTARLEVRDLDRVDYADGLRAQEVLADRVRQHEIPDQLLLLRHPPVVTLGRQGRREALLASPELLAARGIELFQIDRGGDATYHDEGQLVGYPILALSGIGVGGGGVAGLVWAVEELVRRAVLDGFGVPLQRCPGLPGLWLGERKMVALGMRLDRGVSRHGFALNLGTAPAAWGVIVPCGLASRGVISLGEVLGRPVDPAEVVPRLVEAAAEVLERTVERRAPERQSVQVIAVRPAGAGGDPAVLTLHRTPPRGGFWQPVTGMIDPGETPAQTAARELQEETGLSGALLDLGYVHSFLVEPGLRPGDAPTTPVFLREHSFAARLAAAAGAPRTDPREHDDWRWAAPEEGVELMRFSGNRRGIRLALAALTGAA